MNNLDKKARELCEELNEKGVEVVYENISFIFLKNKKPNGDGKNLKIFNQTFIAALVPIEESTLIYSLGRKYDSAIKKIAKKMGYEYRQRNIKNEFDL